MTGRREQSKARTRAAIIEAGIRLMHEQGYDAASTSAIARAAGVSPATLFNYFPTKASIVFADDALWAPDPDQITPGTTPRETLVATVRALLDQPAWTAPADDPLTALRFDLVRREPALQQAQIARGFATVPVFARVAQQAHPGLDDATALALAGSVAGAVLAVLCWGADSDVRHAVEGALVRT